MKKHKFTYEKSGVNINAADNFVNFISNISPKNKGNKKFNNICKKVTIAIFESGSILITGGITFDQINVAYKYITQIIKDNAELLKRPNINIFENL